jgi:hypothetical protein
MPDDVSYPQYKADGDDQDFIPNPRYWVGPRVRVLVGSRRSLDGAVVPEGEDRHGRLHAAFGPDAIIDDLEDEKDTHDDIA